MSGREDDEALFDDIGAEEERMAAEEQAELDAAEAEDEGSGFTDKKMGNDPEMVLALLDRLMPLHQAIFTEPGVAGAKYGMSLLGLCSDEVRLPLVDLTDATKAKVRAAMEHAGLL